MNRLEQVYSLLEPADCILYSSKKWNVIQSVTDSAINHIAMYDKDGYVIDYTLFKGCSRRPLVKTLKNNYILVRRIKGITEAQQEAMCYLASKELGQPYDKKAYIGFILYEIIRKTLGTVDVTAHNPFDGVGRVCSTAYAHWSAGVALPVVPHGNERATPRDIYMSEVLKCVYAEIV